MARSPSNSGLTFNLHPGVFASPEQQIANSRYNRAMSYNTVFNLTNDGGFNFPLPVNGSAAPGTLQRLRFVVGSAGRPSTKVDINMVPKASGPALIIAPAMRLLTDGIMATPGLNAQQLRTALLLWDHLIVPQSKILDFGIGDDARFLEEEGIITRPVIKLTGSWAVEDLARAIQFDTLRALLERDQDHWSIAQGEQALSTVEPEQLTASAVQFQIANAIPVPDKSVPILEVLAFKAKRAAELKALQASTADTRDAIMADPSKPLAEHPSMIALAQAVADQMAVSREWQFPVRLASIDHKIDAKTWTGAAGGFAYAHSGMGLPVPLAIGGAALGAAAVSVSFKLGWRGIRATQGPYEYVWRYHRELF